MLLMGLLIQNIGSTQNPLKMYVKIVPSQERMPDSEGSLTTPVAQNCIKLQCSNVAVPSHHTSTQQGTELLAELHSQRVEYLTATK